MFFDATLLNTQHYKVWIKGKVEQPGGGKEYCPPQHLGVVAIEKGAFRLPSTMVTNLLLHDIMSTIIMNFYYDFLLS